MPLQLGGPETERKQSIVWDPDNPRECLEAGERTAELRKRGFTFDFVDIPGGEVTMDPPPKDPNIGVFRVLSDNGDDRIVWDRRSGPEVKEAYKQFNDFIKKGYTAYAVTAAGQKGHKIDSFDPSLEEIIMVPGTYPG